MYKIRPEIRRFAPAVEVLADRNKRLLTRTLRFLDGVPTVEQTTRDGDTYRKVALVTKSFAESGLVRVMGVSYVQPAKLRGDPHLQFYDADVAWRHLRAVTDNPHLLHDSLYGRASEAAIETPSEFSIDTLRVRMLEGSVSRQDLRRTIKGFYLQLSSGEAEFTSAQQLANNPNLNPHLLRAPNTA